MGIAKQGERAVVMPQKSTNISLSDETRDDLRALKTGGQTYDDVLRELMEHYAQS